MAATDRVKQILSWYGSDNPGTKANLARMLNHGTLAGTGKMVILPGRPGLRARARALVRAEPGGYDPDYHVQLAIDSGCNAYAAPLGFLEVGRRQVRRADPAHPEAEQLRHAREGRAAVQRDHRLASKDALRLGCSGDRLHDLPGLGPAQPDVRGPSRAHPRGEGRTASRRSSGRTRAARASRRTARRRSTSRRTPRRSPRSSARTSSRSSRRRTHIEQAEAKKVFEKYNIPTKTLAERVRHCVQSAFNGKRIVIFSGGEAKDTAALLDEVKGLADGGAFGSIMGRNAFQRPQPEAVKLLHDVMAIYKNAK